MLLVNFVCKYSLISLINIKIATVGISPIVFSSKKTFWRNGGVYEMLELRAMFGSPPHHAPTKLRLPHLLTQLFRSQIKLSTPLLFLLIYNSKTRHRCGGCFWRHKFGHAIARMASSSWEICSSSRFFQQISGWIANDASHTNPKTCCCVYPEQPQKN